MLTMGSGQSGVASALIDRLEGVPSGPAVAAIRARRFIEVSDFGAATDLLDAMDTSRESGEVRAVVRHARLSLGWRSSNHDLMYRALAEIQADPETPEIMRDIAQVFVDASPLVDRRTDLPTLAERLMGMARRQAAGGYDFFAAVSLHNAAVAFRNAAQFKDAIKVATKALAAFELLPFPAPERFSTHAILASALWEAGAVEAADEQVQAATSEGDEFADVAAELAFDELAMGNRKGAAVLLARAESLVRQGRTDAVATHVTQAARAFAHLPNNPKQAISLLTAEVVDAPLDFGHLIARQRTLALAYLLDGRDPEALEVAEAALQEAQIRLAGHSAARLRVIRALAAGESALLLPAMAEASATSELALPELADALTDHLDLLGQVPREMEQSVVKWPNRWLPALRRQLEKGYTASGRIAAGLLDQFGDVSDVGRLRAYARAYKRKGRLVPLGYELARRVSPRLKVRDLGRVSVDLGDRSLSLAAMRRKPAALLMYMVTRPALTANREQVLDSLWPDADPGSGANSLNQTLYFLRRELDPWYEDDFSVDYIAFQGDLIWLDPQLVSVDSVAFFTSAQSAMRSNPPMDEVLDLLVRYRGPFAPEFEYDEWAMAWRSRVHATFLELSSRTLARSIREGDLEAARDVAVYCLEIEPDNADVERRLVWLYWHLGARAAATAQYDHLAHGERADGLEPDSLQAVVASPAAPAAP
jgi:DNA-binding SARP family transcriptional activator/thioredoxin-like negative regulator of GroEL